MSPIDFQGEEREVGAGEIVVVPAGQWHGFVNSGDGPLRQSDIHVTPRFDTEWHEYRAPFAAGSGP